VVEIAVLAKVEIVVVVLVGVVVEVVVLVGVFVEVVVLVVVLVENAVSIGVLVEIEVLTVVVNLDVVVTEFKDFNRVAKTANKNKSLFFQVKELI
jgi:hypothetical protein